LNACDLRTIVVGRERLARGGDLPRHRHLEPYAIVVIRGCFDQVGVAGRVRVRAGDLLVQPTLDGHRDRMLSSSIEILRLPWCDEDLGGVYALADLDAVVRAAERDVGEAIAVARWTTRRAAAADWPDVLATALARDEVTGLGAWAEERGVARETISRGFTAAYGVPARQWRVELRARAAWLRTVRTREPLAAIAVSTGFADQAHMTRAIRALTGASPGSWRRDPRVARFRRAA